MKEKLLNGEKFICCSDSLTEQKNIVAELRNYCDSQKLNCAEYFLEYSSVDGKDEDLENVTKKMGEYVDILHPKDCVWSVGIWFDVLIRFHPRWFEILFML